MLSLTRALVSRRTPAAAAWAATTPCCRDMSSTSRKELVEIVAIRSGLSESQVSKVLTTSLDAIVEEVAAGNKVTLTGFGTFEPRKRAARKGRNPSSGEEIDIPAKMGAGFRFGAAFKREVMEGPAARMM